MTELILPPGLANRIIATLTAAPLVLGLLGAPFAAEPVLLLIMLGILALPVVAVCLQASSTVILSERGVGRRIPRAERDGWRGRMWSASA